MDQRNRDRFGAELRRFAENLDRREFRPLSRGLGFAEVRSYRSEAERRAGATKFQAAPAAAAQQTRRLFPERKQVIHQPAVEWKELPDPQEPSHNEAADTPPPRKPSGIFLRLFKWSLAHGIDLFSVAVALLLSFVIAGYLFAPAGDQFSARLLAWQPTKDLLHMGILEFLGVLYGLFFLYWGFFKAVVGRTFGQTCLRTSEPRKIDVSSV